MEKEIRMMCEFVDVIGNVLGKWGLIYFVTRTF